MSHLCCCRYVVALMCGETASRLSKQPTCQVLFVVTNHLSTRSGYPSCLTVMQTIIVCLSQFLGLVQCCMPLCEPDIFLSAGALCDAAHTIPHLML